MAYCRYFKSTLWFVVATENTSFLTIYDDVSKLLRGSEGGERTEREKVKTGNISWTKSLSSFHSIMCTGAARIRSSFNFNVF